MPFLTALKRLMPDQDRALPVLRGPFRGGVFYSNPRYSFRKILGLYEHELNPWLATVLPTVDLVLDVGGNDGYFTFGAAAAMARRGEPRIVTFEPLPNHFEQLRTARANAGYDEKNIRLVPKLVGDRETSDMTMLDHLPERPAEHSTLVKIDVEGAELDVLAGGKSWIRLGNHFLIEVHGEHLYAPILAMFAEQGVQMDRVAQSPLPILGREQRDRDNGWLLTRI